MTLNKEALEIIKKADSCGYDLVKVDFKEERAKVFEMIMERQFVKSVADNKAEKH